MVELIGDEHLKYDERRVRHLLEGAVGRTRVIDRRGGPEQRQHDLEADLPDGKIAAIEITSEADAARMSVVAAAERHLSKLEAPGSRLAWLVNITPAANARALRKDGGLAALLTEMERRGQSSASAMSDYRDPWRNRLEALGIQSVLGVEGSARPGHIYVMPEVVANWAWVRDSADKWITDFLATKLGQNKLDKLARADADERHLAILIYNDTGAGIGIASASDDMPDGSGSDDLPSVEPPLPLTHLWLLAPTIPARAFRWERSSGWSVVTLPAEEQAA